MRFPMFLIVILFFSFILYMFNISAISTSGSIDVEERIIGGGPSNPGQFPYIAAINVQTNSSRFFCSGSLISELWVITAGSCVYNAVSFTINIGSNLLEGEDRYRQTLETSEYIIHPEYNPNTLENDIGLIKFQTAIRWNQYVQRSVLPEWAVEDGTEVYAMGWGQTSDADSEYSNCLIYVTTTILSNTECRVYYGNQIVDNMVCVGGNNNEGTCVGDTGTPLIQWYIFRTHYVVGVSSFISGNGCESTDPSGYTRVFPYVEWIKNVTEIQTK